MGEKGSTAIVNAWIAEWGGDVRKERNSIGQDGVREMRASHTLGPGTSGRVLW